MRSPEQVIRSLQRAIRSTAKTPCRPKNAEIGFELSHWHTEYQGEGGADSLRAQTSFIYKF
jgi:hypothetical protein